MPVFPNGLNYYDIKRDRLISPTLSTPEFEELEYSVQDPTELEFATLEYSVQNATQLTIPFEELEYSVFDKTQLESDFEQLDYSSQDAGALSS